MANINRISEAPEGRLISVRRTQIYLPEEMHAALKEIASRRRVSMAALIREAVEEKIGGTSVTKKTDGDWQKVLALAGIIKGEPRDVSSNIAKYISRLYR